MVDAELEDRDVSFREQVDEDRPATVIETPGSVDFGMWGGG